MTEKDNSKNENKKKKAGRPAGAKSKVNLPVRNIEVAVSWTKKAYEHAGEAEMSPEDIIKFIEVNKGFRSPAISTLDKFGLIEKASFGWRVSDLGKRVINGEREAIKEALERIDLFRDLLRAFGDKNVTEGVILAYLKKNYKKEDNTKPIAEKYLEAVNYLNSVTPNKVNSQSKKETSYKELNLDDKLITLLKLKYAFYPIDEHSKTELIKELDEKFKDYDDTTIRAIISQIKENKSNKEVLKILITTLLNSLGQKYHFLQFEDKPTKERKKETVETEPDSHIQS